MGSPQTGQRLIATTPKRMCRSSSAFLSSFRYSKSDIQSSNPHNVLYLVATLTYESAKDLAASLESKKFKSAVADLANFATGGATALTVTVWRRKK